MRNKSIIFIVFASILMGCCHPPLYDIIYQQAEILFPKGNKIRSNFTGTAWLQMLANNDSTFKTSISNVTFEPKARTNWHLFPGGQILLVTGGKGYYQERGKPVQLIKKGDVVEVGPDIEHWYGATANTGLTHIAINTNVQKGIVVWLQPVSDYDYNNINAGKP